MPIMYALSIDSGSDAQNARLRNEVEQTLGCDTDPLELLIAAEEGDERAIVLVCPEDPSWDDDVLFWAGLS